jgi:hypothetical protein
VGGLKVARQGGARPAGYSGLTLPEEEEHPGGPRGPSWVSCRTITG